MPHSKIWGKWMDTVGFPKEHRHIVPGHVQTKSGRYSRQFHSFMPHDTK